MNTNKTFTDILQDGIKRDTIRRNSRRSVNWLLNKIKTAVRQNPGLQKSVPRVGRMYVYVYNAKYKDKLPFWDTNPIVIPLAFNKKGFLGINFHYLPANHRKTLLNLLGIFQSGTGNKKKAYIQIAKLTAGPWKFAMKRYLYSHMQTKFIAIEPDEWFEAAMLPFANFQKQNQAYVHSKFRQSI